MWGPQASQQFLKVMAGTDNRAKYEALTALGMTFFIPGPEAVIGRALDGLWLAKAGKLGAGWPKLRGRARRSRRQGRASCWRFREKRRS